jgi:hypothetical protein
VIYLLVKEDLGLEESEKPMDEMDYLIVKD